MSALRPQARLRRRDTRAPMYANLPLQHWGERRRDAKCARIGERTAKSGKSAHRRRDARNPRSQQPRLTAALIIIAPHPDRPIPPVVARLYVDIAGADSRHAFG